MWADSVSVGCGVSRARIAVEDGEFDYTYVACHYRNWGNVRGQYVQNVRPLREDAFVPTGPRDLEPQNGKYLEAKL